MRPKISVVINTLNEERNLGFALSSVSTWADEIVIVDMHSDDQTVQIAEQYGAKIYFHPRVNFVEPARDLAISKASSMWVLILDADEMIPHLLGSHLLKLATEDEADAFIVPRLDYVLGAPLWGTGFGPEQDMQMRFFKKNMVMPDSRIHSAIRTSPNAKVKSIAYKQDLAIVHFCYSDIVQIVEKFNRYTTIEAQQAFERGETVNTPLALLHVCWEFVNRYIRKQGYRDGWRGLYFSGFMSTYRWLTYAKLKELHSNGSREQVIESYRRVAEGIAASYLVDEIRKSRKEI